MIAQLKFVKVMRIYGFLIMSLPLTGCSYLSYYAQSIDGQLEVITKSQKIDQVLAKQPTTELQQQLQLVKALLDFAETEFELPANGSYQHYADLQRPYVLWNIFATPEFSLQPKQWCYPFIGCLSYRGYFNKQDAVNVANQLKQSGYDVFVGGVAAYSTLGWFNDPVLNTMLDRGENYLARVIFHELTHQKLYVNNDTAFNEAFADTVAEIALQSWLKQTKSLAVYQQQQLKQQREHAFIQLILQYRKRLATLFESNLSTSQMRANKQQLFDALQEEYLVLRSDWEQDERFDHWFATPVNNARISAVSTYRLLVSDLLAIYKRQNSDIQSFFAFANKLSKCSKKQRHKFIKQRISEVSC